MLFLFIFLLAFWILLFLTAFALPYAITQWVIGKFKRVEASEETDS